jgi:hypothetical protein
MDSDLALGARLSFPTGVAVDDQGNVFIADSSSSCVREVSGAAITTIAGTGTAGYSGDLGPAPSARLQLPWGVAVDPQGNVYISDGANAAVRKVDLTGTISTIAGGLPGGASTGDGGLAINASLALPRGIAIGAQGALYVTDVRANVVREIADPLPPGPSPSISPPAPQAAPPAPPAPPRLTLMLGVASRQRLLAQHGVKVIAGCDVACSLTVTGTVRVVARRLALPLTRAHAGLRGAGTRTLLLRLPAAALNRLARALRPGIRATATIAVTAADGSGQRATARRAVALNGRRL